MAAAGQRGLDPRQVKAREEFERMREQLTRTLERNVDPTPWRERARERVAAFERESNRPRPAVAPAARSGRLPWMVALASAFVLGVIVTLAVAFLLLRPSPQSANDLAGIVVEAPVVAEEPPAPRLTPARETTPPQEAAAVREPEAITVSTTSVAAVAEAAPRAVTEEEPVPVAAASQVVAVAAESEPDAAPEPVQAAAASDAPADALSEEGDPVARRVAMIREIQTLLAALGYVPGRADGDAGPQTLAAAALFASERGLVDGNLDGALLAALRSARNGALPIRPSADPEETVVERVNRIRETQALLLALGFELGRADGDAGPATLEAAATFAENAGFADANIDAALLAALREASVGGLQ